MGEAELFAQRRPALRRLGVFARLYSYELYSPRSLDGLDHFEEFCLF